MELTILSKYTVKEPRNITKMAICQAASRVAGESGAGPSW